MRSRYLSSFEMFFLAEQVAEVVVARVIEELESANLLTHEQAIALTKVMNAKSEAACIAYLGERAEAERELDQRAFEQDVETQAYFARGLQEMIIEAEKQRGPDQDDR